MRVERPLEFPAPQVTPQHILDFDVETVAAGFADPEWVPQKITCVAWSWVGEEQVTSRTCGTEGLFGDPKRRRDMLCYLLEQIWVADMVTGHNVERFDLPIINAECMRLGLQPLKQVMVQDTMRLARSKGFKKGLDNISRLLNVPGEKLALDWQAWQEGYDEAGWQTIRRRCESDVVLHKQTRERLLGLGVLKPARLWAG